MMSSISLAESAGGSPGLPPNGGSMLMLAAIGFRQIVEFSHAGRSASRGYHLAGIGIALDVECDRLAQAVDYAVVEECLPQRDVAQASA